MSLQNFSLVFLCVLCASAVQFSPASRADGPDLADLGAYREALSAVPGASAAPVGFRDLWEHPETYQGRAVEVEGRVGRTFRQGSVGEFPPLVEAWIKSKAGEPTCLVFPESDNRGSAGMAVGSRVRFRGTFVRKIRYRGGDVERLAPLIVGPSGPEMVAPTERATPEGNASWSPTDWLLGIGASVVIVGALARRHLGRPVPTSTRPEPAPSFVDEDPFAEEDRRESRR